MNLTAQPYLSPVTGIRSKITRVFLSNLQSAGVLAENREGDLFVNVNDLFVQEAGGDSVPHMFLGKEIQQKCLACFMPLAKQKSYLEDEGGFLVLFFLPCSRRKVGQDEQKETLGFSLLPSKVL